MKYLVAIMSFLLVSTNASKPLPEEKLPLCGDNICVVQFNAAFNSTNEVS